MWFCVQSHSSEKYAVLPVIKVREDFMLDYACFMWDEVMTVIKNTVGGMYRCQMVLNVRSFLTRSVIQCYVFWGVFR